VRTALFCSSRFKFWRFRLIWDLMFAMNGAVYQRLLAAPGPVA
jgi:hypothetical protein